MEIREQKLSGKKLKKKRWRSYTGGKMQDFKFKKMLPWQRMVFQTYLEKYKTFDKKLF